MVYVTVGSEGVEEPADCPPWLGYRPSGQPGVPSQSRIQVSIVSDLLEANIGAPFPMDSFPMDHSATVNHNHL